MMLGKDKIIWVAVILAFFLLLNIYSNPVRNFFYTISGPIQKPLWQAGDRVSDFLDGIFNQNLKKENDELNLKIQQLFSENEFLRQAEKENEFLRQALNLGLEKEFELKTARVIGKDVSSDVLIIDKGSRDGLQVGMPSITEQKALVGRISETYSDFAKITLITDPEMSFDVKIGESEVSALARGKGNFHLRVELIPKDEEVKEGQFLTTSALAGVFPAGLLAGEIKKIIKSGAISFQEAEVNPSFDISRTENIFLITNFSRR